jgi:glycosyltransferase involved in cell wall biosynthesis
MSNLPRKVRGFDIVEWPIIDDGSTDDTIKIALENDADQVVRHKQNQRLARAF